MDDISVLKADIDSKLEKVREEIRLKMFMLLLFLFLFVIYEKI